MIKTIALIVVTAVFTPGPVAVSPKMSETLSSAEAAMLLRNTMPPEAWAPQDAADSLYKAAREALTKGDNTRAADLFNQVVRKYPGSTYAGESLYYYAFSLYRSGGSDKLRTARKALADLAERYPSVAKRGDATTLRTRVCGELARQGDAVCAAEVTSTVAKIEKADRDAERADREAEKADKAAAKADRDDRRSSRGVPDGCPGDDDDRVEALNALLQMDADRAMPILTQVLQRRDRCSVTLRRKAVFLISQKRSEKTADLLMSIAKNDPDAEVREQAVFWLGQVPDERAVDLLESILRTSKDEDLQNKALFALSQHRSGRGSAILREFAVRDGASEDLRGQAIFWLGQRNSADNNDFLRSLYTRLTSEELKEKVIFSLSQRKGQGNEKWMMDIAIDSRQPMELRKKALFWAGQSGVGISEIIPLYSRINDQEMKEQVIFVLSQRSNTPAAVDKLLDIAKTDKNPDLRKKAIFWLGQSRDPRVQQFLLDIINK
ncbi:MAG TPA: HEAT repeat domain-containing protein [Gemmatimonadaceae bacterium]|nr:HEAT repeat domain-containing protein [Gemmatimonadaceae bacterium]